MTQDESGLAGSVKDGVIDAIRGAGEITDAVVDTAASSLVNAIQKSSDVGVALTATASEVVRGAIQGTAKVGGALGSAAKGAMIGVLRGTREVGAESLDLNGSEATPGVATTGAVECGRPAVDPSTSGPQPFVGPRCCQVQACDVQSCSGNT